MDDPKLDDYLRKLRGAFPFLWESYGYRVKFLTRDYGIYSKGFIIGLENDMCKLVFEKETHSTREPIRSYAGKRGSVFAPPQYSYLTKDGWYTLPGLLYWLSGIECERVPDVDKDLAYVSQYLKFHMDTLMDLFSAPEEFDNKLAHYRNLYKNQQITVDKIRAERARLQALGQDSSLEAAIASLRGGKK